MAQDAYGNYVVILEPEPIGTLPSSTGGWRFGEGPPDVSLGRNGFGYLDILTGDVYLKYNDVWQVFQGAPGGSGEAGVGSPEGAVTAAAGTTYVDTSNGDLWVKTSGVGDTGWVAVFLH